MHNICNALYYENELHTSDESIPVSSLQHYCPSHCGADLAQWHLCPLSDLIKCVLFQQLAIFEHCHQQILHNQNGGFSDITDTLYLVPTFAASPRPSVVVK